MELSVDQPLPVAAEPHDGDPDEATLDFQYALESSGLIRRRLELTVILFLGFIGVSVLMQAILYPDRRIVLLLAYAAEAVGCAVAMAAVRVLRFAATTPMIAALLASFLAMIISFYNAHWGLDAETHAIALVCLMTGIFVLLPWGWRPQLAVCLAALAGFAMAAPYLTVRAAESYAWLGLVTGATTSVVGAFFLDRYRRESFVRAALLAHASEVKQEEAEVSTALVHVGQTLSAGVGRADVFERVNRLAVDALGCDWSSTFVYDERRDAFRFTANVGSRPEVVAELSRLEFPRSSLKLFDQFRPRELVEVTDFSRQSLVPHELMQRLEVASALYVPVWRGDQLSGVIANGYRSRVGPFSAKQRRLALGIANATAVALENQRLVADLQAANRLKSEFVSTMSHELRTPLNVITGYSEMLFDAELGELLPEQRDLVRRIRLSAIELLDLVSATLDLSRLEAGRDTIVTEWIDLEELFGQIGQELESLRAEQVALAWLRNGLASRSIMTDRVKLKTIVKNLVGNALKFTREGHVEVTAEGGGGVLAIRVRDTGIGIAADHLDTIFEMFRQVDASATRRFGGVGLGLHIAKRLIERLGGNIQVQSQTGIGSSFTVTIPVGFELLASAG